MAIKKWLVDYSIRNHEGEIQECSMTVEAASIEEALAKADTRMVELTTAGIAEDAVVWDIGIVADPDDLEAVF